MTTFGYVLLVHTTQYIKLRSSSVSSSSWRRCRLGRTDSHTGSHGTYELDYHMGTYTAYIIRLSELHVDLFSASGNDKGS